MATLKRELREILERYEIDPRDKSQLWDCHGTLVLYHRAYEIIAAKEGIVFDPPVMIEASSADRTVAMLVVGHMKDRTEWSVGEASPGNSKNAYPYAIAEKRAKDRVVSKLVGLAAHVYSEDEADSFSESKAEVSDASHATREAPAASRFATAAEAREAAGASVPLPACIPVGGHGERIWNEINAAAHYPAINTVLASNATKFRRWSETPEGAAVVAVIEKRAEDRKMEMGA